MEKILRFDQMPISASRDNNGFLVAPACYTRVGVFYYVDETGSVRAEFRPEEEVFADETLKSLSMLPITLEHPPEMINPLNAKQWTVGFSSELVKRENNLATGFIKVTDAKAINAIENADKQEMSCGYHADLEMTEGIWEGIKYDAIQRNIRYNHIAIVERGRAGAQCRIKTDASDVRMSTVVDNNNNRSQKMAVIKIDGIDVELNDTSHQVVAKELARRDASAKDLEEKIDEYKKKIKDMESELEKMQGTKDAVEAELAKSKEELESAKKDANDMERIQKLVAARAELIEKSKPFIKNDGVKLDTLSDLDIKKEVVKEAYPEIDISEASSDRIDGLFEGALLASKSVAERQKKVDEGMKAPASTKAVSIYDQVRERELNRYKKTLEK